jgi:hypothetical protein
VTTAGLWVTTAGWWVTTAGWWLASWRLEASWLNKGAIQPSCGHIFCGTKIDRWFHCEGAIFSELCTVLYTCVIVVCTVYVFVLENCYKSPGISAQPVCTGFPGFKKIATFEATFCRFLTRKYFRLKIKITRT